MSRKPERSRIRGTSPADRPNRSINRAGRRTDTLYFVSDRDGGWKLYRSEAGRPRLGGRMSPRDAEFGRPQWVFGTASWVRSRPQTHGRVAYTQCRALAPGTLDTVRRRPSLRSPRARASRVAGGNTDTCRARGRIVDDAGRGRPRRCRHAARRAAEAVLHRRAFRRALFSAPRIDSSSPRPIVRRRHAFYYPPRNAASRRPGASVRRYPDQPRRTHDGDQRDARSRCSSGPVAALRSPT